MFLTNETALIVLAAVVLTVAGMAVKVVADVLRGRWNAYRTRRPSQPESRR